MKSTKPVRLENIGTHHEFLILLIPKLIAGIIIRKPVIQQAGS
jgi:hypothetical protein